MGAEADAFCRAENEQMSVRRGYPLSVSKRRIKKLGDLNQDQAACTTQTRRIPWSSTP